MANSYVEDNKDTLTNCEWLNSEVGDNKETTTNWELLIKNITLSTNNPKEILAKLVDTFHIKRDSNLTVAKCEEKIIFYKAEFERNDTLQAVWEEKVIYYTVQRELILNSALKKEVKGSRVGRPQTQSLPKTQLTSETWNQGPNELQGMECCSVM